MVLPIFAYGQKVLRKKAKDIDSNREELDELIENMWETMYNAKGIGLAAPQIGQSLRLFIIDTKQVEDEESDLVGVKEVFINAKVIDETGEEKPYEEGCLSIPDIRGDVIRPSKIKLKYLDQSLNEVEKSFEGINARVIQHEYDHIEGILFTEKLQPLRKRLIKRKLENIRKGNIAVDYRMKFAPGK